MHTALMLLLPALASRSLVLASLRVRSIQGIVHLAHIGFWRYSGEDPLATAPASARGSWYETDRTRSSSSFVDSLFGSYRVSSSTSFRFIPGKLEYHGGRDSRFLTFKILDPQTSPRNINNIIERISLPHHFVPRVRPRCM